MHESQAYSTGMDQFPLLPHLPDARSTLLEVTQPRLRGVSIKNGPRNMRNSCAPRGANGKRGTPYCSPNTSCTLRRGRFQSRDNHPSTSNPSSIGSARRFAPSPRFNRLFFPSSPDSVLTRITVGITSATPPPSRGYTRERCNNVIPCVGIG